MFNMTTTHGRKPRIGTISNAASFVMDTLEQRLFLATHPVAPQVPAPTPPHAVLAATETQTVRFADANLETVVRQALDKPEGPITADDMLNLTTLEAMEREIADLSGLQYALNLQKLELTNNKITDIAPLAGLLKLRELDLEGNQVADLTPLKGLKGMERLLLADNPGLTDSTLRVLAKLKRLRELVIPGWRTSGITNIRPLARLTRLTYLYLGHNRIADLAPLAKLTNLTHLHLGHNQITDIRPLAALTKLINLTISENQVTDISPLAGLTNLQYLEMNQNQIEEISVLDGLVNLRSFYARNNRIRDVLMLTSLPSLMHVWIQYNLVNLDRAGYQLTFRTLQERGVYVEYTPQDIAQVIMGTSNSDAFFIQRVDDQVVISRGSEPGGEVVASFPAERLRELDFDLRASEDVITLDFSNGDPLDGVSLKMRWGAGADKLRIFGLSDPKAIRLDGSHIYVNDHAFAAKNFDHVELATIIQDPNDAAPQFSIRRIRRPRALRLGKSRIV